MSTKPGKQKKTNRQKILELVRANPYMKYIEIAEKVGTSRSYVGKVVSEAKKTGDLPVGVHKARGEPPVMWVTKDKYDEITKGKKSSE